MCYRLSISNVEEEQSCKTLFCLDIFNLVLNFNETEGFVCLAPSYLA